MLYSLLYKMCVFRQGEGALTYAGRKRSPTVYGPHHTGKESLDINLLKAEWNSAIPLACDYDAAPEWVTLQLSQISFHSSLAAFETCPVDW